MFKITEKYVKCLDIEKNSFFFIKINYLLFIILNKILLFYFIFILKVVLFFNS